MDLIQISFELKCLARCSSSPAQPTLNARVFSCSDAHSLPYSTHPFQSERITFGEIRFNI